LPTVSDKEGVNENIGRRRRKKLMYLPVQKGVGCRQRRSAEPTPRRSAKGGIKTRRGRSTTETLYEGMDTRVQSLTAWCAG